MGTLSPLLELFKTSGAGDDEQISISLLALAFVLFFLFF